MSELHFIRPYWLLTLPLLLWLAWRWWRTQQLSSRFAEAIDPELLNVLLEPRTDSASRWQPLLLGLGLLLTTIGLAGPTWERLPQPVERDADGLVIVLDLSLSMFAEDVEPSRLIRARQKVTDILRLRQQGFTGLIAYAGDAHAVAPLTDDTRTIINLLSSLSPDMMPVLGSDAAAAISLAQDLLRNGGFQQGRILLVTDSIEQPNAVLRLRNRTMPLSILGVGTAAGGNVPLDFANQPGRILRTQQGEAVRPKLAEGKLEEIADASYGRYRRAAVGDSDVEALLATPLATMEAAAESDRLFDVWADRGHWLALFALPLLAVGFRRGVFVSVPPLPLLLAGLLGSASLCAPHPASAAAMELVPPDTTPSEAEINRAVEPPGPIERFWRSLWARPDQQAHRRLLEGAPEIAATLFEDPQWRAVADYRSGDFAGAANVFGQGQDIDDRYNLGNSLARMGRYEAAIDQYEQTLAAMPDHEDAAFNKALVEQLLEEQERQNANQQQDGEQPEQSQQDGEQSEQSGAGEPQDQDAPPEPGEQSEEQQDSEQSAEEAEAEAAAEQQAQAQQSDEPRDENAEALEQWLRRVPDDPGGLLRRKFQYETNQRLRTGELKRRQAEQIW
ncbi:MAG: VWA domain-containing protein [Pseudomonadota bacterium]